jgi:transposase
MSLEVTTYLRLQADARALEQQTRQAFIAALVALTEEGVSGLEASRRLGVSQPHVSRVLGALRASGILQSAPRQAGPGRSEEAVPAIPAGP